MWDEKGLVLYAVDPSMHELHRGNLVPERVCEQAARAGGNALRLTVHCSRGFAYFPSEIAPLAPTYPAGKDLVGEFALAAQTHRLQIAYAINVASNPTVAEARPEWRQIRPDGEPHTWGGDAALCVNSDYLLYLTEFVREFVARYGPDCLCIDHFTLLNGFRCPGCRGTLLGDTGIDLADVTPSSAEQVRYAQWRFERTERLAWQLAMAAKQYRGDCQVVFGGCHWSPERHDALGWRPNAVVDWTDNVQSEVAPRWYGHSLSETDLAGAFQRALGKQGWCWVEQARLPFGLMPCPPHEIRAKLGSALAAGSRPCVWPTVVSDPGAPQPSGELLGQFADDRDRLQIDGSFARTGILAPAAHPGQDPSTETVRAWCEALTREHVLWEFLLERDVQAGDLSQFRLIIVPGTPHVDSMSLAAIETFVRQGGSALFVGGAASRSDSGDPLADFAAAGMLGVSLTGAPSEAGYLRVGQTPLADMAGELLAAGAHENVRIGNAQLIAEILPATRPLGGLADAPASPGITWRLHGGGKAAYIAAPLDEVLLASPEGAFVETERLVGELVRWLGGQRIRIRAPRNVVVQVYRSPGGATVHIVNRPATGLLPPPVCERVEIAVPQTLYAASVRALDGTDVAWELRRDELHISVRDIVDYRCLHIEGAVGS